MSMTAGDAPPGARGDTGSSTGANIDELQAIITDPSDGFMMMPSRAMDEVYPGLYVGDG